jgi:hypothetical protein
MDIPLPARNLIDEDAVGVIRVWIEGLDGCP